jgi:mono/diheme cytochrome c family protein
MYTIFCKKNQAAGLVLTSLFLLGFIFIGSQSMAQSATPWVAPKDVDNLKNPLAGNPTVIPDAKALYISNCGPCHGDKGRGDGPAAAGLNPKPADHSSVNVQSESDGALFWKMSEGRAPMPAYKKIFTDQQRWELIDYIRTLAKNTKKK